MHHAAQGSQGWPRRGRYGRSSIISAGCAPWHSTTPRPHRHASSEHLAQGLEAIGYWTHSAGHSRRRWHGDMAVLRRRSNALRRLAIKPRAHWSTKGNDYLFKKRCQALARPEKGPAKHRHRGATARAVGSDHRPLIVRRIRKQSKFDDCGRLQVLQLPWMMLPLVKLQRRRFRQRVES
jgi:hypothetical protein